MVIKKKIEHIKKDNLNERNYNFCLIITGDTVIEEYET